MIDRIRRIFKLDFSVFDEIEADPNATGEAVIVVLVVSLAAAIGTGLRPDTPRGLAVAFVELAVRREGIVDALEAQLGLTCKFQAWSVFETEHSAQDRLLFVGAVVGIIVTGDSIVARKNRESVLALRLVDKLG